jgi:Domain of unknown function (DUF4411)
MYVFDNSPLSTLFRNYYPSRFPSLWKRFDILISDGTIVSTREVLREINDSSIETLRAWAKDYHELFQAPTAVEGEYVAKIFAVGHMQQNIEMQKLLRGGKNADPFVVAKGAIENRAVVTMEKFKDNATKIPNICKHFGVPCLTLEEFMEKEGWSF